MSNITVCGFYTPNYTNHYEDLKQDCELFGYSYSFKLIDSSYLKSPSYPINLWMQQAIFICEAVEKYGKILWLDIESRIIKSLPKNWISDNKHCFLAKRYLAKSMPNSMPIYNSGFCIYSEKHLNFLKKVKHCASKFKDILDRSNTKLNYEQGWNDEYIFDIIRFSDPNYYSDILDVEIDYTRDIDKDCYINRGYFVKANTVILHPRTRIYISKETSNCLSVFKLNFNNILYTENQNIKLIQSILDNYSNSSFWKAIGAEKIDKDTYLYCGWYFNKTHIWPKVSLSYEDYIIAIKNQKAFEIYLKEPSSFQKYREKMI